MREINRFLANALGAINGLLAVLFMGVAGIGVLMAVFGNTPFWFAPVSVIAGVVLSAIVCGPIALMVEIRDNLRDLNK